MYDTHVQVVSSILVCDFMGKTFELMLQIWKVRTSSIHVALISKNIVKVVSSILMWFVDKYF